MNFLAQITENEIARLHNELETMLKSSMDKAIEIGERLTEAQEEMSVGEYKKWVEEKLPFSMRSAQRYKRAFTYRKTLETTAVSQLTKGLDSIKVPKEVKLTEPKPETPLKGFDDEITEQIQEELSPVQEIMDVDPGGMVIPENLKEIFDDKTDIFLAINELKHVKNHVLEQVSDNPLYRLVKSNPFTIDIDNCIRALKFALPSHVCRYCSGTGEGIDGQCPCCKGAGWVNRVMFDNTPSELK